LLYKVRHQTGQISIWYLALFAVALLIVAILAIRQVRRATTTQVWAARQELPSGAPVQAEDVVQTRISDDEMPADLIGEPSQIVGRVPMRVVPEGKPFTVQDFSGPARTMWLADELPPGRVLSTVGVSGATIPTQQLRNGDRLDIVAGDTGDLVARDAWFLGTLRGSVSGPKDRQGGLIDAALGRGSSGPGVVAFVIALRPADAVPLAQAQASGSSLLFVLHGSEEVRSGRRLSISKSTPDEVEVISGKNREKVGVKQ